MPHSKYLIYGYCIQSMASQGWDGGGGGGALCCQQKGARQTQMTNILYVYRRAGTFFLSDRQDGKYLLSFDVIWYVFSFFLSFLQDIQPTHVAGVPWYCCSYRVSDKKREWVHLRYRYRRHRRQLNWHGTQTKIISFPSRINSKCSSWICYQNGAVILHLLHSL